MEARADLDELRLVRLSLDLEEAYMEMAREHQAAPGAELFTMQVPENYAEFVAKQEWFSRGERLPEGWVPQTFFCLMRGDRMVGVCRLRHSITPALEQCGGHIGYGIRPTERGKGYGTQQLRLALDEARKMGLKRVLITCNKDNIASYRVMEKNGGVRTSDGLDQNDGTIQRRYWIDL